MRYFSIEQKGKSADINIYGDITSFPYYETDTSAYKLSQRLAELEDCTSINVYINSYGGEVAEGLAIYNALKRHKAKIKTVCDGFACSIASVIFMAGDERVMNNASLLMIHNAWTDVYGANSEQLKKAAEDLDTITSSSKQAYLENINITEEELTVLMDAETWLTPDEALEKGFATSVIKSKASNKASQCVREKVMQMLSEKTELLPAEPVPAEPEPTPEPPKPSSTYTKGWGFLFKN